MTKILKKVQLSTEQSTLKSADPTKGTQINPFTQEEMAQLQEEGTWEGGYVEGMGLIVPMMMGSDSGSDPNLPLDSQTGIKVAAGHSFYHQISLNTYLNAYLNLEWYEGYTGQSEFPTGSMQPIPNWNHSQVNISALNLDQDYCDTQEEVYHCVELASGNSGMPNGDWELDNGYPSYRIKIHFNYIYRKFRARKYYNPQTGQYAYEKTNIQIGSDETLECTKTYNKGQLNYEVLKS